MSENGSTKVKLLHPLEATHDQDHLQLSCRSIAKYASTTNHTSKTVAKCVSHPKENRMHDEMAAQMTIVRDAQSTEKSVFLRIFITCFSLRTKNLFLDKCRPTHFVLLGSATTRPHCTFEARGITRVQSELFLATPRCGRLPNLRIFGMCAMHSIYTNLSKHNGFHL